MVGNVSVVVRQICVFSRWIMCMEMDTKNVEESIRQGLFLIRNI